MKTEPVTKENLEQYKELILPYIYDEFKGCDDVPESGYFGLAAFDDTDGTDMDEPVSVLIIQPEPTGDLNIVSIYTRPEYRRRGFASALLDTALQVARQNFQWEEGETEDLVVYKTLYRLPSDLRGIYEAFLLTNHFTEFYELDEGEPGVFSASKYIRFFREL